MQPALIRGPDALQSWRRRQGCFASALLTISACAQSGASPNLPDAADAGGSSSSGDASTSSSSSSSGSSGSSGGSSGSVGMDGSAQPEASAEAGGSGGADGSADGGAVGWHCPPGPFATNPIPMGAIVTRIAGVPPPDANGTINQMGYGFSTIEGPVWIGSALLVSEFPGSPNPPPSRILQVAASGAVLVTGPAGWNPGTNGLAVDVMGNVYGAVHADGSISLVDVVAGTRTPVASQYMGKPFNAPNDLAIRSDGNIYFSDPIGFQSPSQPPQAQERVYRVAPGTHAVSVVDPSPGLQPLTHPNGVTLSLDETTLYVSSNNGIYAFPVMPDGTTGPRPASPVTTLNIDGMTLDCAGNLYGAVITSGSNASVVVLSPSGTMIGSLAVPNAFSATNVAFGGVDRKTLFITAQGSGGGQTPPGSQAQGVFQVALSIPGMPY
jgi:gluconolactonase